jgi:hypothetical protein
MSLCYPKKRIAVKRIRPTEILNEEYTRSLPPEAEGWWPHKEPEETSWK